MASAAAGAGAGTRKNIRGTSDYRIYFLNLNMAAPPDLTAVRVNGRPIRVYSKEKVSKSREKILTELKNPEFCAGIRSYAGEVLREEHGKPEFALLIKSKDTKELLGLAITMQVWHEQSDDMDYPRDPAALYIEVLCGSQKIKGAGSILMNALEEIGKVLGKSRLELTATPSSKPFYEHIGFVCGGLKGHNCTKSIVAGGRRKTRRRARKSAF